MQASLDLTIDDCIAVNNYLNSDYTRFYTDFLGMKQDFIWSGMRQIAESVRKNQKTCVYSGHSLSKDYGCARLALAYLYAKGPKCSVIVTGPGNNQVENIFFREVGDAYNNAIIPLQGKLTTTKLEISNKWFMLGFTTDRDETGEATRFQGFHNEELLVIFTEAAGVPHHIWSATEHLIIQKQHRWLVYGNATSATGDFADCIKDPTWNIINLSVKDSPNFIAGEDIIPGVSGKDYERKIRLKYGEDSDEYRVRVEGKISSKKQPGSYYAKEIVELYRQNRVAEINANIDALVYTVIDPGYTTSLGLFQPRGTDVNVLRGYKDQGLGIDGYGDLMLEWKKEYGYRYGTIFVPIDMDNNAHRVTRGETALEVLRGMGFDVQPIPRELNVIREGIPRTRHFLKRCWFSATNCKNLLKSLENYHEKVNKTMSNEGVLVYTGVPEKDGNDHDADMMRYMSMVFEKNLIKQLQNSGMSRDQIDALARKYRR